MGVQERTERDGGPLVGERRFTPAFHSGSSAEATQRSDTPVWWRREARLAAHSLAPGVQVQIMPLTWAFPLPRQKTFQDRAKSVPNPSAAKPLTWRFVIRASPLDSLWSAGGSRHASVGAPMPVRQDARSVDGAARVLFDLACAAGDRLDSQSAQRKLTGRGAVRGSAAA